MEKAAKKQNIYVQFFEWYFFDQPKAILRFWKNLLKFNLNYFSISLLLKTFFSPWRRQTYSYGRGFDFKVYLETFISNVIFRSLGAILRFFLIIIGILLEFLIILVGIFMFIGWFLLPIILIAGLILGFKILF